MNDQTRLLAQGTHPEYGNWYHIALKSVEEGVSHVLTVVGNKATLHRMLITGESVAQEFSLPVLKEALAGIDAFVALV